MSEETKEDCYFCETIRRLLKPNMSYVIGNTIYCVICRQGYELVKVIQK